MTELIRRHNRTMWMVLREVWAAAPKRASKRRSSCTKRETGKDGTPSPAPAKSEGKTQKPVKDGQQYIKKEVLKELPLITSGMIRKAKGGGTAPLKLLWELGKLHEDATVKRKRQVPSLGKLLMDEVRRKEAQKQSSVDTTAETGKQK